MRTRCGHLILALSTALGTASGVAPPCAASLLAQDIVPPGRSTADSSAARHDWHLDLAVHHVGVGIGNSPDITGLRLNFRDDGPIRVQGVNVTLWTAYEPAQGVVRGVAIGLPLTGARHIAGVAAGIGIDTEHDLDGLALTPIGVGAGNRIRGVTLAGIGAGSGNDVSGIALAGLGLGSGGSLSGLMVGGLGVGAGNDMTGIIVGGIGAGAGGNVTGLVIGGVGAGAGGNITGITIAGIGAGAGGQVRGVTIAGIGVGAGGSLEGIAISAGAAGAPRVKGLVLATAAGGDRVTGVILAPAYFRVSRGGRFVGLSASAFNYVKGAQHGLTIGIFNFAHELHGLQLGLLNYAGNNHGLLRLVPLVNAHR
ncbi:MAG TPA: hypothetical protein VFW89_00020 [Gemmatimonadaceae bacterium]|nr:hypothetical protein [Gemmatimonadaceae bacterium]